MKLYPVNLITPSLTSTSFLADLTGKKNVGCDGQECTAAIVDAAGDQTVVGGRQDAGRPALQVEAVAGSPRTEGMGRVRRAAGEPKRSGKGLPT